MWKERAVEALKKKGYKMTPQRLKLLEVLDEIGERHPSLGEVHNALKGEFPTVSFSTLYSNVLTLRELGLVELFSLEGETRIEVNTKPHVNLIEGSRIIDVNDPEIIEAIRRKTGRNVKLVNVLVE
ncbi:Fur family transcriptional regulator [Thermococcus sp.]|uniref:Fur family transcriptional regulator n=1 Tax=Thermococcus sp. TaxID=35749 RepID=UPI0026359CF5|nr:Fur family transcriptional regulator [Thermococcus sp.]